MTSWNILENVKQNCNDDTNSNVHGYECKNTNKMQNNKVNGMTSWQAFIQTRSASNILWESYTYVIYIWRACG